MALAVSVYHGCQVVYHGYLTKPLVFILYRPITAIHTLYLFA